MRFNRRRILRNLRILKCQRSWNFVNPFTTINCDFQLSILPIDMHWWDLNTKSFRRFSAINITYWHALVGPQQKIFSAIFSYQKYLLTCIGGTLTQNRFSDFQLSRILIDMHWRNLNTKIFQRFSAIKITYWHALVGPQQKIFSAIFSYEEYLLTYIGKTLTQKFFGNFKLSRYLLTCIGGTSTQCFPTEWNFVIEESKKTTKLIWSSNNARVTSLWINLKWIQTTDTLFIQSRWRSFFSL